MKTLDMMIEAMSTKQTYISRSMRYSAKNGFYDKSGNPWAANAFDTINEIMCLDNWKVINKKKMTLKQIEEELGYPVEIVSE